MKTSNLKQICISLALLAFTSGLAGCDKDFYLSEKEVAAYNNALITETSMNMHFGGLKGRSIDLVFDNSTGTPRLQSSNLLTEMRLTTLAQLETGKAAISLDRLNDELETQIGKWIEGKLELYTNGSAGDRVRLTSLDTVTVRFHDNPSFAYRPEDQNIAFNVRVRLVINGTIEVNAVNWLINIFTNINGTYPLKVVVPDLRLKGETNIYSPLANAGRIRFQMVPEIRSPVEVTGTRVPNRVKDGVAQVMTHNLSVRVDEVFTQEYHHFAMPQIRLTSQNPSRLEVSYRSKADWLGPDAARPQLHIVTRGTNGQLYHARKSNGGWSGYKTVPFPSPSPTPYAAINNDPALVHSGNNQLELAATNAFGDVVYAHYRDEEWGNTWFIQPNTIYNPAISYRGTPAVAASAPGQVEIIVEGSDGNLWHHRRVNGIWVLPIRVPATGYPNINAPFRDPAAVHIGNKIVVVFVDGQSRLAVTAFDLESGFWGQPAPIAASSGASVTILHSPAIVASGERHNGTSGLGQIDLAYVRANNAVYHQRMEVNAQNITTQGAAPGIFMAGGEKHISGVTANSSPVLTSSTFLQPELFVRGTDGYLRHNHFVYSLAPFTVEGVTVNPGWQGWSVLKDNFFASTPKTDGRVEAFRAAGTRSGKTVVAAHAFDATKRFIFHEEYESGRYGRSTTPWKTVHWRGWEMTGPMSPVGRPAIVAVDTNFQIANIGNRAGFGPTVHVERVAETNATHWLGMTMPTRMTNPVDPVVLASGPGMYDTIALDKYGRPEHRRHWSNGSRMVLTLSVPSGVTLTALSAAGYGNGFIELAATATNNRVYHWRYRGGVWSQPTVIANQIISAPILIHKGAGQIELLAVDFDHHLFRWRFLGNAWQPRLSIAHDFRINNLLFSSRSASSWGDGTIDLVVVGLDTRALYHRRIGPGDEICSAPFGCPAPRVFVPIGGSIWEDPVLTAFSPTRLNVLTMQGLRWHSIWANKHPNQWVVLPAPPDPRLMWSGFEYVGGDEMIVGGTAHAGRNNFAAVAILDGHLYINRNLNGSWSGFQPIIGQQPDQIMRHPIILPAIAGLGD